MCGRNPDRRMRNLRFVTDDVFSERILECLIEIMVNQNLGA